MFNSALKILQAYIDNVTPYNLYSIELKRSQNPEDLYYLCRVDSSYYVVFESNYIYDLPFAVEEIRQTFDHINIKPLYWLVKEKAEASAGATTLPLDTSVDDTPAYKFLIHEEDTSVRHAVLAVEIADQRGSNFDPTAYGYSR